MFKNKHEAKIWLEALRPAGSMAAGSVPVPPVRLSEGVVLQGFPENGRWLIFGKNGPLVMGVVGEDDLDNLWNHCKAWADTRWEYRTTNSSKVEDCASYELTPCPPDPDDSPEKGWELMGTTCSNESYLYWTWRRPLP